MSYTRCAKVVGLLLVGLLLSGCSGSDGSGVKLAPVTGRVIFKNQPLTAAEIYFNPDTKKGNQGEMGSDILNPEDGTFTIKTYHPKGTRDGVAPGAYKVTLGFGRRRDKELIKFRMIQTTPLKIEVPEEGGEVLIDLDKERIDLK